MNQPFISIIIPYYNVPMDMLVRCVNSLCRACRGYDYEVWIVDDCSQSHLVLPWVERLLSDRVHAARAPHGGPGGARNYGIDLSHGEYICFVDADDYVVAEEQQRLLALLQERRPDVLAQGCLVEYDGAVLDYMAHYDICPSCCSYFIRREKLAGLRFTPDIYHEDEDFCTRLHMLDASLLTVKTSSYFYSYRRDSITHNRAVTHLEKRFSDYATVLEGLDAVQQTTPTLALQRRLCIMAMSFVVVLMDDSPERDFTVRHLSALRRIGLYPLALRWYGARYFLIALTTRWQWAVLALSPLVRKLMRYRNGKNNQRAFVSHPEHIGE